MRVNEVDLDAMVNEALLDHRELRENREIKDSPECPVRRAIVESRVTLERMDNPDMTVTRVKTVLLDCPVCQEKWDLGVSQVKEVSRDCRDPRESLEVKVLQDLREIRVLLVNLVPLDKQVLLDLLVHQGLRVFLDLLVQRVLAVNPDFLGYPVLMVYLDIMETLELLEPKETPVALDLK